MVLSYRRKRQKKTFPKSPGPVLGGKPDKPIEVLFDLGFVQDSEDLYPRRPRSLACPFYKFDPKERHCLSYGLSRVKDIKQHIFRRGSALECKERDTSAHTSQSQINNKTRFNPRLRKLSCWEVPGTLNGVAIHALPDSGSTIDTISESLARRHNMELEPSKPKTVRLPGGGTATSTARVLGRFKFRGEHRVHERYFYVLHGTPAYDVVLSKTFLDETKTLTHFSHRIVKRSRMCVQRGDRLCLLDETPGMQDQIRCSVNGVDTSAFPDTGSDLMLVSGEFARRHGFKVLRSERYRTQVELIDGSSVMTDGMVLDAELEFDISSTNVSREISYDWLVYHSESLASLIIPSSGSMKSGSASPGKTTFICDLHVIEGLPCDIILSNEFIFENKVFSRFSHLFHSDSRTPPPSIYLSNHLLQRGGVTTTTIPCKPNRDNQESLLFMRIKTDTFSWLFSRQRRRRSRSSPSTTTNNSNHIPLQTIPTSGSVSTVSQGPTKIQIWQAKWDAEESRRNRTQLRIEFLPEPLRSQEEQAEARRQRNWDRRHPHPGTQVAVQTSVTP